MRSFAELIVIVVILLVVVGPASFIRYKLYSRFLQSQESIADSLRKIAEHQINSH